MQLWILYALDTYFAGKTYKILGILMRILCTLEQNMHGNPKC